MRKLFLPRLAVRGLYGNRRLYLPFLLASSFMVMVFYLVASFTLNDSFGENIPHGGNIRVLMSIGYLLLPIVIFPFLLYVNSFLIKGRSRELALYAVLGLERRHVAAVLFIESVICCALCLVAGIGAGAVLSPLVFEGLLTALGIAVDMTYTFSFAPVLGVVKVFAGCFAILLIANILRALRTRPASLLQGQKQGEKPLRGKPLIALAGAGCLLYGYYLSLTAAPDSRFITSFFFAVLLVIFGTYGLFTAGSVEVLRRMRMQGSRFYTDSTRFIVVTGLLHRMRKNAAGLVNLCLFGTMALFTLTCSVSVLLGQGEVMKLLGQTLAEGQIGLNTANITTQELQLEFVTLAFLGIFFVLVFLACTALILYYKQLSEGMEDASRFRIMRAVGLSDDMTRRTARRQLRVVFLLPLGGALVHLLFAAPILSVFLQVLAISELWVLAAGLGISALLFCAVYAGCYRLTSAAYLKAIS